MSKKRAIVAHLLVENENNHKKIIKLTIIIIMKINRKCVTIVIYQVI